VVFYLIFLINYSLKSEIW